MSAIFISYRRHSAVVHARAVYERLLREFGSDNVFIDLGGIDIGADFVDQLDRQLNGCRVLLALIDPHWISVTDRHGRRRLEREDDFVRIEITRALARGVVVVPILLDGAEMPAAEQLPPELRPLTRRNALALDFHRFDAEATRLADSIRRLLSNAPVPEPSPEPPPASPPPSTPPPPVSPPARASRKRAPAPASVVKVAEPVTRTATGSAPEPVVEPRPVPPPRPDTAPVPERVPVADDASHQGWLLALGGAVVLVAALAWLPGGRQDDAQAPPPEAAAPVAEPVAAFASAVADMRRQVEAVARPAASAEGEAAAPRDPPGTVAVSPPATANPTGRRWILEFGSWSVTQLCAMVKADPDFAKAQVWRLPNPNRGLEHLPQKDWYTVRFDPTTDRAPLDAIRKTYLAKGVFSVITSPAQLSAGEHVMTCPATP